MILDYGEGRDLSKLCSIEFQHAATFSSNDEKIFSNHLKSFLIKLKSNESIAFPYKIHANDYHVFEIGNSNEIEHVKYLYKSYLQLVSCVQQEQDVRAFYYLTEDSERRPKSVHNYKNVQTIDLHQSEANSLTDCWNIKSKALFSPHFRTEPIKLRKPVTGSILKLNLDFEYMIFIFKKFTNFCI